MFDLAPVGAADGKNCNALCMDFFFSGARGCSRMAITNSWVEDRSCFVATVCFFCKHLLNEAKSPGWWSPCVRMCRDFADVSGSGCGRVCYGNGRFEKADFIFVQLLRNEIGSVKFCVWIWFDQVWSIFEYESLTSTILTKFRNETETKTFSIVIDI